MREDHCAICGQRIALLKVDPATFRWVTDPSKPESWKCYDPERPDRERRHAPLSMQGTRR